MIKKLKVAMPKDFINPSCSETSVGVWNILVNFLKNETFDDEYEG